MTELILVRHGETAWNTEKRLQGHTDTPLNAEGRRQAQALATALAESGADLVISSDLERTRETAAPIARILGCEIKRDRRLRERCFGAFEGLQHHEIQARFPEAWQQWQNRQLDARYPVGERPAETLAEFGLRVADALADLGSREKGKRLIIVTHGGVLDSAYRMATGMDLTAARNFEVRNASINRFSWHDEHGLQLRAWGEVAHIQTSLDEAH